MTIWIVEQGEYSDRHDVGFFSSHENAKTVADWINEKDPYDRARILTAELDAGVNELREGLSTYHVTIREDGTVENVFKDDSEERNFSTSESPWFRSLAPMYHGMPNAPADVLQVRVWARDVEHATKVANERRSFWLATGEWERKRKETEDYFRRHP